MTRRRDRQGAVELRKQGKTYSEIKNVLGVAKSTLSNWLSKYPLTPKQFKALEGKEMDYWSKELHIPLSQFVRPYIKKSKRVEIDHKGYDHGTCSLFVHDSKLKEKVLMAIQTIADFYAKKNNL